ncbi:MAG: hypothetical protein IKU86_12995 [Thermoguttaceae bacterium]|nr:hypothetical protein [Thermoguttaceae bacterium]
MNVADYALVLSSRQVATETRRDSKNETESSVALKKLRDAQKIAAGKKVDDDLERRERVERRSTPKRSAETPSSKPIRRDGDERGRLLDVYC